jgi:hypothetical protein
MNSKKIVWVLSCFKCKSVFQLEVDHSKEYVILLARKTACPTCGHLPKLIDPDKILTAIELHTFLGVKLPPELEMVFNHETRDGTLRAIYPGSEVAV